MDSRVKRNFAGKDEEETKKGFPSKIIRTRLSSASKIVALATVGRAEKISR
jgi:hypothetical protein